MIKFKTIEILSLLSIGLATTISLEVLADNSAIKSTYNWTGVYVGGFVGGASGANVTNSDTDTPLRFEVTPLASSSTTTNYSTSSSFMGGGTVGYNWQLGKTPYLIGLEGEYGYLGQSGSSQSQSVGRLGIVHINSQNKTIIGSDYGYGLVGGRLGYVFNSSLFYIKSGAIFTQVNSTNSTNTNIPDSNSYTAGSANAGGITTGYAIGGGVEYAPTFYDNKNFSVKVEYLYFGIPTTTNSSQYYPNLGQRRLYSENAIYNNSTGGISTAKIGINYKF